MKFIVVENDSKTATEIKEIIRKVTFNYQPVSIETYAKVTEALLKTVLNNAEPKTYILDIELDCQTSGITLAKKIREKDWESHIIFITSHDKMFEPVYRTIYEVFDFVEKFHEMNKKLERDLETIIKQKFDNKLFYYSAKNTDLQLFLKDITHIERDTNERKLIINTTFNKFIINMTISQILGKLDSRFKQCHRACIVNTERVVKFDWQKKLFILDNGAKIPLLSKKYQENVINND